VEEWKLGRHAFALNLLAVPVLIAGLLFYSVALVVSVAIAAHSNPSPENAVTLRVELGGNVFWLIVFLAILITLIGLHEAIHGLVFHRYGASPSYGFKIVARFLPVFYCTAPGTLLTKRQFAMLAIAPTLAIVIPGWFLVLLPAVGSSLVLPLALHFTGCLGDWWILGVAGRKPPGTMVEDQSDGVIFYLPDAAQLTRPQVT
jgi:hypothetical protein